MVLRLQSAAGHPRRYLTAPPHISHQMASAWTEGGERATKEFSTKKTNKVNTLSGKGARGQCGSAAGIRWDHRPPKSDGLGTWWGCVAWSGGESHGEGAQAPSLQGVASRSAKYSGTGAHHGKCTSDHNFSRASIITMLLPRTTCTRVAHAWHKRCTAHSLQATVYHAP